MSGDNPVIPFNRECQLSESGSMDGSGRSDSSNIVFDCKLIKKELLKTFIIPTKKILSVS